MGLPDDEGSLFRVGDDEFEPVSAAPDDEFEPVAPKKKPDFKARLASAQTARIPETSQKFWDPHTGVEAPAPHRPWPDEQWQRLVGEIQLILDTNARDVVARYPRIAEIQGGIVLAHPTAELDIGFQGEIGVGKFVDRERPTWLDAMNGHHAKVIGEQYRPWGVR